MLLFVIMFDQRVFVLVTIGIRYRIHIRFTKPIELLQLLTILVKSSTPHVLYDFSKTISNYIIGYEIFKRYSFRYLFNKCIK